MRGREQSSLPAFSFLPCLGAVYLDVSALLLIAHCALLFSQSAGTF